VRLLLVLNTSGKPATSMESIKQPGDRTARRQAHLTNNIESDQNQINSEQEPSERKTVEIKGKKTRQRHCSSSYQNTKRNKKEATSWTCEGASITYKKGDQMDLNS
jgi:hypothetical protein